MIFKIDIVNGKSTVTDESGNSLDADNVVFVNDPDGGATLWLGFFNASASVVTGAPATATPPPAAGATSTPTPSALPTATT